ncbi:MAG: hypothetical protein WC843_03375 [Candidatus Gracilibacteria bacterium]|jgi:hypothetical protein
MLTPLKITRDKGVDLKRLNKLRRQGLIKIYDVKIENETSKVPDKILPVGVWGHTKWDECIWGDEKDNTFDKTLEIIGKENIKDAIHLEAHIRNKFDYFVTNNPNDFIKNGKREKLELEFPILKILTIEELEKICQK